MTYSEQCLITQTVEKEKPVFYTCKDDAQFGTQYSTEDIQAKFPRKRLTEILHERTYIQPKLLQKILKVMQNQTSYYRL